jgi:hypothetical protein
MVEPGNGDEEQLREMSAEEIANLSTSRFFRMVDAGQIEVLGKRPRPRGGELEDPANAGLELRELRCENAKGKPLKIALIDIASRFIGHVRHSSYNKCMLVCSLAVLLGLCVPR